MMGLSAKAIYGINAIYTLGFTTTKKHLQIRELSALTHISAPYLEQILLKLRKADIVESIRGPQGGYSLKRELSDITVLEVVEVLDGGVCDLKKDYSNSHVVDALFSELQNNVKSLLNMKFSDLHQRFQPFIYEI